MGYLHLFVSQLPHYNNYNNLNNNNNENNNLSYQVMEMIIIFIITIIMITIIFLRSKSSSNHHQIINKFNNLLTQVMEMNFREALDGAHTVSCSEEQVPNIHSFQPFPKVSRNRRNDKVP